MLSEGPQQGFEAYLRRVGPGSDRFNEHGVRNYVDEKGQSVTECWLECEDDATFEIVLAKTNDASGMVLTSDWRARVWVDGQRLAQSSWYSNQPRQKVWDTVHQQDPHHPDLEREGTLQFKQPVLLIDESANKGPAAPESGTSGTIRITLDYGRLVPSDKKGQRKSWQAPQPVLEAKAKIGRTVDCQFGEVRPRGLVKYTYFEPAKQTTWHTFVFKYRHRVFLELQGIIAAPAPAPVRRRLSLDDIEEVDNTMEGDDVSEDVKPLAVSRTLRQATRIRKLEAELRAERARNGRQNKRPKGIDLTLVEDD